MSSKILMSFHSFMTFMVRCSYKYNISYKCSDLDVEISKSLHVSCPTLGFPGAKNISGMDILLIRPVLGLNNGATGKVTGVAE